MKLSKLVFCFIVLSYNSFGQFSPPGKKGFDSTEDRYTFPVNPGTTNFLSGSMGELRSTHFHAGLDIRTNNMEGIPIHAAMGGYVSRIILGTGGYGKVMFVTHPNGQTTVYAHLSALKGQYGDYARRQQYAKKSFEVDLFLKPDELSVKQGDTIGFSGNTGGSNGAHLHFEIRDKNNEALNPLKFDFGEIKDTYTPVAQKIALKTMDPDARINDHFGRFEFYVYKVGNNYIFSKPIMAHGHIGVELLAYDIVDQYKYICGINYIDMKADSQRVFTQTIEKINFLKTREILTVMDFKTLKNSGTHWNKLYVDDGNGLNYNTGSSGKGVINIEGKDMPVSIDMQDTYGNASKVAFVLKATPVTKEINALEVVRKPIAYDLQENTMVVSSANCPGEKKPLMKVFYQHQQIVLSPAYGNASQSTYLIDLRKTLPDSVTTCHGALYFDYKDAVPSGTDYKYYGDFADVRFQRGALYDTLYLNESISKKGGKEVFTIGNSLAPLHLPVSITLKPEKQYPNDGKIHVYRVNGRETAYLGGTWNDGKVTFNSLELGNFTLLRDTIPPALARLALSHGTARFRIRDQLSGIGSFTATINGEWLLMNYDYKTGILQSERLDPTKLIQGDFVLKVVDNAGNENIYTQKIY